MKTGSILSLISGNLRELRKRGCTAADCHALEKIAILVGRGRRDRFRPSDLARLLGVNRSTAHWRLRRLADFGLVVRVRHVVFLNVAGVLSMAADAVKARLAHARALILRKKTGFVRVARPIEQDKDKKRAENEGSPTVADEIREIRVGDTGTDGRKVIGFRQMGRIPVPVWG